MALGMARTSTDYPSVNGANGTRVVLPWGNPQARAAFIVTITPEIAAYMLAYHNNRNRPLNRYALKFVTREIKEGRWIFNGQSICIRWDGMVLNGQHRLQGCVDSGISIETVVVTGLDDKSYQTMDQGRLRSLSDDLAVSGEKNCSLLAASLDLLWKEANGTLHHQSTGTGVSRAERAVLLDLHPNIRYSVFYAENRKNRSKLVPPRIVSYLHYKMSCIDDDETESFFRDLIDGTGLEAGDPVYVLREILVENAASKRKRSMVELMALTIKAWNHRRKGTSIKFLRWRTAGDCPEHFPAISD
jgi:hypothetical protein